MTATTQIRFISLAIIVISGVGAFLTGVMWSYQSKKAKAEKISQGSNFEYPVDDGYEAHKLSNTRQENDPGISHKYQFQEESGEKSVQQIPIPELVQKEVNKRLTMKDLIGGEILETSPALGKSLDDFHGPDWEGADGPHSKAGFDLCYLYHQHALQNLLSDDNSYYKEAKKKWAVTGDGIVVDVFLNKSYPDGNDQNPTLMTDVLQAPMYEFGGVITGFLPIKSIPSISEDPNILFVRPSQLISMTELN